MQQRHPLNTNLTLVYGDEWRGLPLLPRHQPFVEQYLQVNLDVLRHVFGVHSRVFMVLLELRFPFGYAIPEKGVITRFTRSLNAQLEADLKARRSLGGRRLRCRTTYVWARERKDSAHSHYHVALFFNHDAYHCLGKFPSNGNGEDRDVPRPVIAERATNTSARLSRAWASALGVAEWEAGGLIHYPDNPTYTLDIARVDFITDYAQLFKRLSYMAKAATKDYGSYLNCYGSSRTPSAGLFLQPTGIS